jgi:WD40 repeat protein
MRQNRRRGEFGKANGDNEQAPNRCAGRATGCLEVTLMLYKCVLLLSLAAAQPPGNQAVDQLGDPLPPGAVARLGTLRFKHEPANNRDIDLVVFAPDGAKVATLARGNNRGSLRLWDAVTGRNLPGVWNPIEAEFSAVAFAPDSSMIAAAERGSIMLWDFASAKIQRSIPTDFGFVQSVAFADNGRTLVAASGSEVRWWDVATGKQKRAWNMADDPQRLAKIRAALANVVFTPSPLIAVTTFAAAKESNATSSSSTVFNNILLSPDGRFMAALDSPAGMNGARKLRFVILRANGQEPPKVKNTAEAMGFDLATGQITWRTSSKADDADAERRFAFSADGKLLAVAEGPRKISVRNTSNGKLVSTAAIGPRKVDPGKAQSAYLAVVERGLSRFIIFDPDFGESTPSMNGRLALSPDGTTVAFASDEGDVALYRADGSGPVRWLSQDKALGTGSSVQTLAFSPDGKRLAVASGAILTIQDVDSLVDAVSFNGHHRRVDFVAFSADSKRLLTGNSESAIGERNPIAWDTNTWKRLPASSSPKAPLPPDGIVSPDLKTYSVRDKDGRQLLYDPTTQKLLATLTMPKSPARSYTAEGFTVYLSERTETPAFFSPDGRYLVRTGHSPSGKLAQLVYGIPSGKLLGYLPRQANSVEALRPVAFAADGRLAAAFSAEDGLIHVVDLRSGNLRHTLGKRPEREDEANERGSAVATLAFSFDGKFLASWSSADSVIRIWDMERGQMLKTLPHDGEMHGRMVLAWSADGRCLAVADRKIQIWELATMRVRRELTGHAGEILAVTFSADGRYLAAGGDDTTVLVWDMWKK